MFLHGISQIDPWVYLASVFLLLSTVPDCRIPSTDCESCLYSVNCNTSQICDCFLQKHLIGFCDWISSNHHDLRFSDLSFLCSDQPSSQHRPPDWRLPTAAPVRCCCPVLATITHGVGLTSSSASDSPDLSTRSRFLADCIRLCPDFSEHRPAVQLSTGLPLSSSRVPCFSAPIHQI